MERRALGVRSIADDESRMKRHILPELGDLDLGEVQSRHVRAFVFKLRTKTLGKGEKLAPRTIRNVYGLLSTMFRDAVAEGLIASEQGKNILIVAAEKLTSIMDWTDRTTAVLFGDGAGATLMRPATGTKGVLSSYMKSDGTLAELLYRPGGGAAHPPSDELLKDHSYYIKMAGREVFKAAVLSMADACDHALERAGLTAGDLDLLIPHQANIRIIEATAKHAGLPMDKVYVNVDRFGNTSAASIAIALDEAVKTGRLTPGMTVMFVAFGAGFTWASMVVKW